MMLAAMLFKYVYVNTQDRQKNRSPVHKRPDDGAYRNQRNQNEGGNYQK